MNSSADLSSPVPCPRSPDRSLCFELRDETAVEDFGNRSLVLLCDALQLRELNEASRRLLARLDGQRTIKDIIGELAAETGEAAAALQGPVAGALLEMERQGIIRRVVKLGTERPEHMSDAQYLRDPDVSFRQEDDAGGILYHPETDALAILNSTAVEIWTLLAAPHTRAEIVAHLCRVCEGAPEGQVEADVTEFVEAQLAKGFIGVVESSE